VYARAPTAAGSVPSDGELDMTTWILFVGLQPEAVDFSDPELPPGFNAEKIHAGIAVAMREIAERGWQADLCLIQPDETAGPTFAHQLSSKVYDCVVIGAGVRLPPKNLWLLEVLVNAVLEAGPGTKIAFNTRPEDSADAAARWVKAE
jgi:hypothetical protein